MPNYDKIIDNFPDVKVLVIGDVMLDRYLWGSVKRISPEAPVPIVKVEKTSLVLGGAANVAANITGLGGKAILIGVTGDDAEADALGELLEKSEISSESLMRVKNRPTTIKTRIVAHNQHVVRIDRETNESLAKEVADEIFHKIENLKREFSIVVVSDYAKGVLTDNLLSRLIKFGKSENKMILIDPKGNDFSKYKGATLLTPNQREASEACGLDDNIEELAEELVEKSAEKLAKELVENAGKLLLEKLSLAALLITRGEKGMTILQKGKETSYLKATARKVYDVTGAGDTVIAAMAVALGSGVDFRQAAEFANLAAGLAVEKVGTTIIKRQMIEEHLQVPGISSS